MEFTSSGNFFSMMQLSLSPYRTFFSITATTAAERYISPSKSKAGSVFDNQWYPIRSAQDRASSRMVVDRGPLIIFLLVIGAKNWHLQFSSKNAGVVDTLCCQPV